MQSMRILERVGGIVLIWFGWLCLAYILWVHEFYGFHHDYALGIFAWLMVGQEDGFVLIPNPCGIVLNLGLTAMTFWFGCVANRHLVCVDKSQSGEAKEHHE